MNTDAINFFNACDGFIQNMILGAKLESPRGGDMSYAIMVREYGSDHEVELCRVGSNPEAVAAGARQKMLRSRLLGKSLSLRKYMSVRIEKLQSE
jgi:hypothetical protein